MEEKIISFKTAKIANKKGFIEWTEKRYNKKGTFNESKFWNISAPTQSTLEYYLFVKHSIQIEITFDDGQWFIYVGEFSFPDSSVEFVDSIECDSFKDAILKKPLAKELALQKALNLL